MKICLGDVIATRSYVRTDTNKIVTVSIGKPIPFEDNRDYYCPYQISGIGNENVLHAGGIDSVQALQLALNMIKFDLDFYFKSYDYHVKWEAGEGEDIGF